MLRFVNIQEDFSYLERFGTPDHLFGVQLAPNNKPLDFQYQASESISKFQAIKINPQGIIIEVVSLSTSLVVLDSGRHICSGQLDYNRNLGECLYYFNVNDKYHSELFKVTNEVLPNYLRLVSGEFLELENGSYLELET